jgi:hypothetical protein
MKRKTVQRDDLEAGLVALRLGIMRDWKRKFEKSINTLHPSLDSTPPSRKANLFMDELHNLQEELSTIIAKAVEDYYLIAVANRRLVSGDLLGWIRQQIIGIVTEEIPRESDRWVWSVFLGRRNFAAWAQTNWRAPTWLGALSLIGRFPDGAPTNDSELMAEHNASDTQKILSTNRNAFGATLVWACEDALERVTVRIAQRPKDRPAIQRKTVCRQEFDHSDDYGMVTFRGRRYSLTPRQAAIVEILHRSFEAAFPDVSHRKLMNSLETEASRTRDSFKRSELWGTLIVQGKRKGTLRLNLGDTPKKTSAQGPDNTR